MATQGAYQPYLRRPLPPTDTDPGRGLRALVNWLSIELQNIQRAILQPGTKTITASYTATPSDGTILANATTGNIIVTLPAAARAKDCFLIIKKVDASANTVALSGVVDGTTNPSTGTQYTTFRVQSDGVQWWNV